MKQTLCKGFSLLEVLLAVIVITVAGLGAYALFDSGIKSSNLSDATDEMVQIGNVYTDLASSDLTSNVAEDGIMTLLQNSGRLSNKYFTESDGSTIMSNPFGTLTFSDAPTPYSFSVTVPLGCLPSDSLVPKQFFNKVQDLYSCDASGGKDYDACASSAFAACSGAGSESKLTLYFNLNN